MYIMAEDPSNNYAMYSSGGFSIQQDFAEIQINDTNISNQYDVNEALQIKYSVRRMNSKIGITKDASNNIIFSDFDTSNNVFYTDEVTITADDILDYLTSDKIISMGKLSTLYEDFNYTVLEYFGAPFGFSSLFSGEEVYYNINNGIFNEEALIQLFNKFDFNIDGTYVTDLSGNFKVNQVTNNLKYATTTNVFDNRATDSNIGHSDGFIEGDLIYMPDGITITMKVDIEPEPYTPLNNVGPTNLSSINNLINYTEPQTNITKQTTSTVTNITQTYRVPILIVLVNEDEGHSCKDYGIYWVNRSEGVINVKNWLSISISATGKYQTAIEEYGDIYISSDYGVTWAPQYNIGASSTNNVSISLTGQYQTAANGIDIYTSNNYGVTWNKIYNFGTTRVFVRMCLTGQHQAVISSGDGLYQSSDYGASWTKNNNINGDLYNSILSFPTAGISMSFDGKRQLIVCEAIYLSTDYGTSWITTTIINDNNSEFDDHNWVGCDMSSDGRYMTAIEVTGEIYTSSDFGNNWIKNENDNIRDREWQDVSISAVGKCQTAIEKNGYVFTSTDFGVTWTESPEPILSIQTWQSISVSSSGRHQSVVVYGGDIYTSTSQ